MTLAGKIAQAVQTLNYYAMRRLVCEEQVKTIESIIFQMMKVRDRLAACAWTKGLDLMFDHIFFEYLMACVSIRMFVVENDSFDFEHSSFV